MNATDVPHFLDDNHDNNKNISTRKISKYNRPRLATIDVSPRKPSSLKSISDRFGTDKMKKRVTLSLATLKDIPEHEVNLNPSLENINVSNFTDQEPDSINSQFLRQRSSRKSIPKAVLNNLMNTTPQQLDENTHLHVKKKGVTFMLAIMAVVITLSSFQYGWAIGVVNAPQKIVTNWYNQTYYKRYNKYMTPSQITGYWALTVAIANLGGLFGGLLSGFFCDKLGRFG
ncbi:unnamed protein product [Gordionus sp. m RMFG-2023]